MLNFHILYMCVLESTAEEAMQLLKDKKGIKRVSFLLRTVKCAWCSWCFRSPLLLLPFLSPKFTLFHFFLIAKAPNWPIRLSLSAMSAPCHSLFTSKIKHLELLTFSPVEFSEARPVAAGQLWGAAEGRWQEVGHQRTVAGLCGSPDQNKAVRNSGVICGISKLFACERSSFVTKTRPCWNYNNYLIIVV